MFTFLILCGVPPVQAITFAGAFYFLAPLLLLEGRL